MQQPYCPSPIVRRARLGALFAFVTNGALLGSLLPRYPEVAAAFDLTTAQLGLVVAVFAVGATSAAHLPGWWLRRFGSRAVTTWGTWIMTGLFMLAGIATTRGAPGVWAFAACLFLAGVGDAIVDVSQNSQGLRVEEAFGRSLLSSMHAGWSAGAALGGALGALAATAALPLPTHLALAGVVSAVVVTLTGRLFLPDLPHENGSASREEAAVPPARLNTVVITFTPLVLIALGGFAVEDVGNNWAAYFLHTEVGLPIGQAGLGVATVLGAQFVGRVVGDRLIDALGPRVAVRASLLAVTAGMVVAAWAPHPELTFAGFALAGLGCAVSVPVAYAQANSLPHLAPHQGIAVVGWLMRFATLGMSPAVGLVGQAAGLRVALTGIAIVAVVGLAFSRTIRDTRRTRTQGIGGP